VEWWRPFSSGTLSRDSREEHLGRISRRRPKDGACSGQIVVSSHPHISRTTFCDTLSDRAWSAQYSAAYSARGDLSRLSLVTTSLSKCRAECPNRVVLRGMCRCPGNMITVGYNVACPARRAKVKTQELLDQKVKELYNRRWQVGWSM
jgi:hypothetical protein